MLETFWEVFTNVVGALAIIGLFALPIATLLIGGTLLSEKADRYYGVWKRKRFLRLRITATIILTVLLCIVEFSFLIAVINTPGNLLYDIWNA